MSPLSQGRLLAPRWDHGIRREDCGTFFYIFIVAFLENATIEYSLESVCVYVCVRVCVRVCTITRKEIDLGT